ncbi:ATP-dependent DNA helicase [Raphidocelis subcapitata]|uniref:ATP-dependent DNA helicase n=1 Tax=Raphidocelis subcapitata TaxID=307507 RepID=A0A2V0P886_9CHLO|nr:ATP-dependent DNA helicase [Raphidocelis subcapitata]|eukprot:GBF95152.1 ATP-dependent DNA helicase [Raphidocelis subcapitata]
MGKKPALHKMASTTSLEGVVNSTQPVTEEEAERVLAPETMCEEEERLRHEREGTGGEDDPPTTSAKEAVLSEERFKQLDKLLDRTGLYTQFLTEQLAVISDKPAAGSGEVVEEEEEPAGKGKKGKRRGGKAAAAGTSKRQKNDAEPAPANDATSTKALLPLIEGELREYQLKGVRWLISLWQNGLNGILADQMGLGKTVQTIGLLSHLRANGIYGPFMILGPLSVLPNWVSEVERWCPQLPVILYHGSRQERAELRARHMPTGVAGPTFPVIVTSFEIVMADIKPLSRYSYKYIVVDEGHRLKNNNCRLLRELRTLSVQNKLLLTGTPLQNNLSELWSLLNYLLPDIFSNLADFESWFDIAGSAVTSSDEGDAGLVVAEQRARVVDKLHSLLKPFLLRRIKADVEIALPRKQELLLYAPMSKLQRELNQQLLERTLADAMAKVADAEGGSTASLGKLSNVLMQMRKNCNHPDLITGPFSASTVYPTPEEMVEQCGKMALMQRLLDRLKAGGHKVLIFSQMTKMLDLIESYLDQRGERACRIDGSIPWQERQANIRDFNADPDTWLFLLSTRAGGLGINLTSADTVIIYDSDWNPHQDLQAMDRCHRIGQTRPVLVLRLATAHSVEGKMLKRASEKMALERLVIKKGIFKEVVDQGASVSGSMNAGELLELLRADFADNDVPQSAVVDEATLSKLLDRTHLAEGRQLPYPPSGVGYEVVQASESSGLLSNVE